MDREVLQIEGLTHCLTDAQGRAQGHGGPVTGVINGSPAHRVNGVQTQGAPGIGEGADLDLLAPSGGRGGGAGLTAHIAQPKDLGEVGVVQWTVPGDLGALVPDGQDAIEGKPEADPFWAGGRRGDVLPPGLTGRILAHSPRLRPRPCSPGDHHGPRGALG